MDWAQLLMVAGSVWLASPLARADPPEQQPLVIVFDGGSEDPLSGQIRHDLRDAGFRVMRSPVTLDRGAEVHGCALDQPACRSQIFRQLEERTVEELSFLVSVELDATATATQAVRAFDRDADLVTDMRFRRDPEDYILSIVVGLELANRLKRHGKPELPLSDRERRVLDWVDEPPQLQEETPICEYPAHEPQPPHPPKPSFDWVCRRGPRQPLLLERDDGTQQLIEDERPRCQLGPVFGYWRPRTWVMFGATLGGALGTGLSYGMALDARRDWKRAKHQLDRSGLSGTDPSETCDGGTPCAGTSYADLAGQVSETGARVKRRAFAGDVLLGTTALFAVLTGVLIRSDRARAKVFLLRVRELDVTVSPVVGSQVGVRLRF